MKFALRGGCARPAKVGLQAEQQGRRTWPRTAGVGKIAQGVQHRMWARIQIRHGPTRRCSTRRNDSYRGVVFQPRPTLDLFEEK